MLAPEQLSPTRLGKALREHLPLTFPEEGTLRHRGEAAQLEEAQIPDSLASYFPISGLRGVGWEWWAGDSDGGFSSGAGTGWIVFGDTLLP